MDATSTSQGNNVGHTENVESVATGAFPTDPGNRKVILVLQQHDVEKCGYEPGGAQVLLNEEAFVLPFPLGMRGEPPVALRNILDAGIAHPGAMLVQSPFDVDTYEDAFLAPQRFALCKHMCFSMLCMHLGAKEVSVEQVDLRTRAGKVTIDAKGERLGGNAHLTIENEELEGLRAEMRLHDEFSGGPPDVVAAERLLRSSRLWSEPNMRTLLDMRRDGSNQLKTRRLVLNLSNEGRTNLNVVGRLSVPGFVKLSAKYDRVVREQCDYTLTVVVRF